MRTTALYKKALKAWGWKLQAIKLCEELGELQQAMCKYLLKQGGTRNLTEEMADVEIMIGQMKNGLSLSKQVKFWKALKLKRMETRLIK